LADFVLICWTVGDDEDEEGFENWAYEFVENVNMGDFTV
jgi:hypothetical protein